MPGYNADVYRHETGLSASVDVTSLANWIATPPPTATDRQGFSSKFRAASRSKGARKITVRCSCHNVMYVYIGTRQVFREKRVLPVPLT